MLNGCEECVKRWMKGSSARYSLSTSTLLEFWHLAPTRQTILLGSSTSEHRRAVPQKEGNSGSHNPAILEGSLDASQREDPDAVVTGDLLPPNQWQGTLSLSPQP